MLYAFTLGRKLRGEEPYYPEKGGKGGSSSSGAKEAARATQYAADLQNQQFNRVMEQLAPYAAAGLPALQQIQQLSTLEGQNSALNQYYNSDQYKQLADQARYQSLNAAEATGGLGSTATSNQIASIAPTLGQNWLSGQMQNYGNLLNVGQSAAAGQASAGQNYANNAGNLAQQMAAIRSQGSGQSTLGSAISGGTSGALAGAGLAGMLDASTPWGAGIGAGIGLLGSLF
ncbi:TPA: DNA transfer protein [Salmonella enterica subsp. enterica serovar Mgulani]